MSTTTKNIFNSADEVKTTACVSSVDEGPAWNASISWCLSWLRTVSREVLVVPAHHALLENMVLVVPADADTLRK